MKPSSLALLCSLTASLAACGPSDGDGDFWNAERERNDAEMAAPERGTGSFGPPLPAFLEAKVTFASSPRIEVIQDDNGETVSVLEAGVARTTFAPAIDAGGDPVRLSLAEAVDREIVSPARGGCDLHPPKVPVLGTEGQRLQLSGRDLRGRSECQAFLRAVEAQSLVMKFRQVPQAGGAGYVDTMLVTFGN